ncbi:MAG: hypothetical protein UT31_C0020G0005 [Parcubacteria group bacterium GW2011_GWF2_39_13b]|nr:MAG: hypothetical protein UT31_C0020G0005 [Parcubacteria group bacterium GW2011_GWF2_39_13b]
MSKRIKNVLKSMAVAAPVFLYAAGAMAAVQAVPDINITSADSLLTQFVEIMNWIFSAALILAVILIIFGGISYMTAGGDETKLGTAKKRVIWGLVGAAIVIAAWGLIALIAQYLGASISKPS